MPPANRRRSYNLRSTASRRVRAASNQNPESIPRSFVGNDESNTENQRDNIPLQPITLNGSVNASNNRNDYNSTNFDATDHSTTTVSTYRGQRDLLIDLLNNTKVDCVVCQEYITNDEHIWSCRCCFQIMHLKCIMVWFLKSHTNFKWRCPTCQNSVVGKPIYVCFCGSLRNPFSNNNMNIPHSCGEVCGLKKENSNTDYGQCQHKCTLLCHPGPCPQCTVQVLRYCGCGKTNTYVQCGQSTPVLCQNKCSKLLDCSHICEKNCHGGKCGPCKEELCIQESQSNTDHSNTAILINLSLSQVIPYRSTRHTNVTNICAHEDFAEELRMLGLEPNELIVERENQDIFLLDSDSDEYSSTGGNDSDRVILNRNNELREFFRRTLFHRFTHLVGIQRSNHTVENNSVTGNNSSISSVVSVANASNSSSNAHNSSGHNEHSI